jgi:hypothetical protein
VLLFLAQLEQRVSSHFECRPARHAAPCPPEPAVLPRRAGRRGCISHV